MRVRDAGGTSQDTRSKARSMRRTMGQRGDDRALAHLIQAAKHQQGDERGEAHERHVPDDLAAAESYLRHICDDLHGRITRRHEQIRGELHPDAESKHDDGGEQPDELLRIALGSHRAKYPKPDVHEHGEHEEQRNLEKLDGLERAAQ